MAPVSADPTPTTRKRSSHASRAPVRCAVPESPPQCCWHHLHGPNLAKTKILAKDNTVNQVDCLHGGTRPAHAVREKDERERFAGT